MNAPTAAMQHQQHHGFLTRKRIWIAAILGLVLVLVALVGIKGAQIGSMISAGKSFVPPPEAVTTGKAEAQQWQASRSAVGSLVAVRGVTLSAEVSGLVREIRFESGAFVRKGDVLVRMDTSMEQAQLQAARADADLAKTTLDRAEALRKAGSNSPADLDAASTRARQTAANVATLEATIAKKTIRAPFDGRMSIRQVELGQVLSPGTPIASLQAMHPIYVDFWLPQQALADLKPGMRVRMRTDVFPKQVWEGSVTTINPEVDVQTRNVRVRATIPNPDGKLRPGMFANVDVLSPEQRQVVVVPSTAVMFAPYGDSIFTVEPGKDAAGKDALIAKQKFVRLGERRGDLVAVISGINPGETVVTSGAFKLRNGAAIIARNDLAPAAELSPTPVDR